METKTEVQEDWGEATHPAEYDEERLAEQNRDTAWQETRGTQGTGKGKGKGNRDSPTREEHLRETMNARSNMEMWRQWDLERMHLERNRPVEWYEDEGETPASSTPLSWGSRIWTDESGPDYQKGRDEWGADRALGVASERSWSQ